MSPITPCMIVTSPLHPVTLAQMLRLTEETEECATFYGRMLDHDYTTKEVFNKNFFKDWRKTMNAGRKDVDKGPVKMRLHRN